jgi:hypothetical protein
MMRLPVWVSLCLSKPVVRRALYSALIVGMILIAINHGDALIRGEIDPTRVFKIILTILVPYLVSTISSVLTIIDSQKDPPHE